MNKYALHQFLHWAPLAAVIGLLLAGGAAHAATITVNTDADGEVGSSPGVCTLRSAIHAANVGTGGVDNCDPGSAGADEIVFAPGLANSTITLSDGQMKITDALTITGPVPGDPAGMTIDGDGQSRILLVNGAASGPFDVYLDSISLTGGYGNVGGGLYVNGGDITLVNSTVSGNTAGPIFQRGSNGGGMYVYRGDVTLINSSVSGNTAGSYGGGLYVHADVYFDGGNVTLTNSTVSGNTASFEGGGLFVYRGNDITLTNSTVSGNTAIYIGGGLYVNGDNVTLTNSTVAYNTDGIFLTVSTSLALYNSLVVQAGTDETACNQAADEYSNTLATDTSCTGTATTPALIALNPLADNGGPTQTHMLNAGSTAIDAAGDCATDFNITEDQRGAPRPIDGDGNGTAECDTGAYEFQDVLFRDRFEQ